MVSVVCSPSPVIPGKSKEWGNGSLWPTAFYNCDMCVKSIENGNALMVPVGLSPIAVVWWCWAIVIRNRWRVLTSFTDHNSCVPSAATVAFPLRRFLTLHFHSLLLRLALGMRTERNPSEHDMPRMIALHHQRLIFPSRPRRLRLGNDEETLT